MRRMVILMGLLASVVLASAAFILWPSTGYALNRQLEPIQPGLYSSGQDGGCDDPDSKDRMLITKSEIHLYETHCRIRRISAQGYFYEIDTDCEAEGERGSIKFEIAPLYLGTVAVQLRKGGLMSATGEPVLYRLCVVPRANPKADEYSR
ncbi:hypothetical protein GGQ86_004270 [Xanthobacter flavus]|uniref:Uncharacterized protein n=1 Tax=Xanthobacter flavus TaxID=281 RepID=A0A9W6CQE7_XANFL|nr:hypothetical protein [Xanthobacter flavus]MDR6335772.1 hypothetical protein [Xanthobacter flavus]GLI24261.1 hypothetical protein XFLAVUS301_39350 [Xanthobacter flavus]